MNKEEYVEEIISNIKMTKLPRVKHEYDNLMKGECAIIGFLSCFRDGVSAGRISDFLGISTARVAAALNNLEAKEYIIRSTDSSDRRKTIVKLTAKGLDFNNCHEKHFKEKLDLIIDEIGLERFKNYIDTSYEIRSILERKRKDV